jgi:beta-glucosidase
MLGSLDVLTHELHQDMVVSRDGANVKGYSVWSLMDMYEIFGGYKAHFGLIRIDFKNPRRQRQPRLSAHWYSDFLKNNVTIQVESGAATATSHAQI